MIDLELIPGDSTNTGKNIVMSCDTRSEKIWEAMADMFGYKYEPSELYLPIKKTKKFRGGSRYKKTYKQRHK